MPKWTKPSEGSPVCDVGDRVLIIVMARRHRLSKDIEPMLAILEATETGWRDVTDGGYDMHDAELWAYEESVTAIVNLVS